MLQPLSRRTVLMLPAALGARAATPEHRFSTLFTAQDVRDRLSSEDGLAAALAWCRGTRIGKAYVESFRDGYQAGEGALRSATRALRDAGIEVSGCVTTTGIGKRSTGWKPLSCYTDAATQEKVKAIFEYTGRLFDEIMIDDFWFTDCTCQECEAARTARTVALGGRKYPVGGDTWEDYRRELFLRISREYVAGAAKRVNPKARLILKYPQWYDRFHERGYDVTGETEVFDRIWVGTETRDIGGAGSPSGVAQYEAYFIMRWLGGIGGEKTGGGWYDPLNTTERTYVEQARQTVLAGARESMLFCYGALQRNTGPANVAALRTNMPELVEVAGEVARRQIAGIAAYKPPNSHPEKESYVFDQAGMMGLPLVPVHRFPHDAPAAFFSVHALKDTDFRAHFARYAGAGRPVLITDGLARRLDWPPAENILVLAVRDDPKSLAAMPQADLDRLRTPLLKPLGISFRAPNRVALYVFSDGSRVIENFNDDTAAVEFNGEALKVAPRGWMYRWTRAA